MKKYYIYLLDIVEEGHIVDGRLNDLCSTSNLLYLPFKGRSRRF